MRKLTLPAVSMFAALVAFEISLLTPALQGCEPGSDQARVASMNKLKQLASAMMEYAQTEKHLPPHALYGKGGKTLLSWRVLLLPYLGEEELYKQFHLDEPWDSPHNKKLCAKIPKVYQPVLIGKVPDQSATFYQVVVGEGAAFEGRIGHRIPADFRDGTKNTLLIVEAAEPVPWTKPVDLTYAPKSVVPKLGGQLTGGYAAAFADTSVLFLKKGIPEASLRALITRNGGETVNREDFAQ